MIIIGILVALALPQFIATKERALSREAKANLKLISVAAKIYQMKAGFYYPYSGTKDKDDLNANLKLSLTETNWNYSISSLPANNGTTFNASADRVDTGVPSPYKDCRYFINKTLSEPINCTYCP